MSAALLASPAAEFAVAVRAALSDLTPEEVDELTDGLEADLADRLADADADPSALGDPGAYAEELRAAAGLPHRPVAPAPTPSVWNGVIDAFREAPRAFATVFGQFGAAHPSLARLRDFFLALRPLWWVFRAVVVTALIGNILTPGWWMPVNGVTITVGIVALVLSVQFGRGKWLPYTWMRGVLLATNLILVITAPFIIAGAVNIINGNASSAQSYAAYSPPDLSDTGLLDHGNTVSNIFAYDAQGNPLTNVQLFDQNGKPLDVSPSPTATTLEDELPGILIPNQSVPGRLGWNVYPLAHVSRSDVTSDGAIKRSAVPTPAKLPFASTTPLATTGASPSPSPTGTPAPTAAPTPGATSGPTPGTTPTP